MQPSRTSPVASSLSLSAEPKRPAPSSSATPLPAAGAPQPLDAELLKFVGGAGLSIAPVNNWGGGGRGGR